MHWDAEADVLVAGAGGAGLQAALAVAATGASAIVFEKQARLWESSTAIAVGRFSFAGTDVQQRCGVVDSPALLYRDISETGRHLNAPALVQAYVDEQLETYRQLCALGIEWSPTVVAMAGMSVPRGHLSDTLDLVRILRRACEAAGVPVLFRTPVTGLVCEHTGIDGVTVRERNGAISRVRARRGVVLATGGFARDPQRLRRIDPRFAEVIATSGIGHEGDGLRMAEALGADMRDLEHIQPSFELHAHGSTADDILLLYYRGAVIVNMEGRRFVNESLSYKDIGRACLDQPGRMGFQVFDARIHRAAVAAYQASRQASPMTLDPGRIRLLSEASTLEGLGATIGLPPGNLEITVERYNRSIREARDPEFGRRTLAGNHGVPVPIEEPPFYAFATVGHLLATYGGIAVDAGMRVLRRGEPIPGLYAAGEAVGGFHGASYHAGTALGKAVIFGRIAGRNAAMRTSG